MPKKVFELAKELDLGPLDLVEKLKNEGFDVRNHMSSLSDDDVTTFLSAMNAKAAAEQETKKKTKKKVVKKKVAKKKVAKKATKASSAKTTKAKSAKESDGEEKVAKKAKTKSTVIRRKVPKKSSSTDEVVEPTSEEQTQIEGSSVQHYEETVESKTESSGISEGLRVISRPESKVIEQKESKPETKEEKLYKEKTHKFTPVYIPPKSEAPAKPAVAAKPKPTGPDYSNAKVPPTESEEEKASKKRFGDLASMMSGKKTNFNRAQTIIQTRADSELKSYAAVSGTGRPIYTQIKKKKIYMGDTQGTKITEVKDAKRVVGLHGGATVEQLAKKLSVKLKDMIDAALDMNLLIRNGDYIGLKLASQLAAIYDYRVEDRSFDEDAAIGKEAVSEDVKSKYPVRAPIIAIMGHVDHGKTTLLDSIREAKVASGEAGGITQHIGAYSVCVGEKKLTFLDTPGHAAFASMRQRGADITDIVVLVVAADDGVMPQTKESVKFCKNSGVPVIVAVNKMDKEGANPDRIKQELVELELTPEDWGGDTQFVPISALKGDGLDDLLDNIALQAEMLELRANDKGIAEAVVVESKVEQGRGPVATVLIQSGTLKKGDSLVAGESYGRARSLTDHLGQSLNFAGPSTPVQILGLDSAPSPGDILNVVKNEREAKKIVQNRVNERIKLSAPDNKKKVSLEDFFAQNAESIEEKKTLNLIIRTDVQGSFEAIKSSLEALSNNEVEVKLLSGGVGAISESDIQLAETSNAFVIGFNMRPVTTARKMADVKGIDIKTYSVIYKLIDDIKLAIEGLLDPDMIEEFTGRAEVRETFTVPKIGVIAGSYVIDGSIKVGCNIRLLRDGKIMFDGKMASLKRFKDDVKEVKKGLECGVGMEEFTDIKAGDLFEAYMMIEKKRTLEDVEKAEKIKAEKDREEAAAAAIAVAEAEAEAAELSEQNV